jgi:hypothetical protein
MAPDLLYRLASGGFMKTNLKNTILVVTAALALSACAPRGSDSGTSDLTSRLPDTNTSSSTKPLAYCNQATASDITAKLRAYVDPSTNTVRMDYMLVRLTALPANFKSDTAYISMFRWLANTSGAASLDSTALSFYIMNPNTGLAITSWKTTLRWSDVSTAASSLGYSDPTSFFAAMKIVVNIKDTNGDYDVLRIVNYELSTNKASGQVDALMPLFYANPADYATESTGAGRAAVLTSLHPFKSSISSGYTSSQFQSMANSYCF